MSFVEQLNIELIKSVEAEKAREAYHFEYELINANDEEFGTIAVKGYKEEDESPFFECRHELAANVSDLSATDVRWVNDTEDIKPIRCRS